MYKISLVNMPFAALRAPSFALTQLKSVLDSQYGDQVSVEMHYLNQEFACSMGVEFYNHISDSMEAHNAGLGEWFFRQAAFPQLPNNTEQYFQRYFPYQNERTETLKRMILDNRQGIDQLLDSFIDKYKLDQAGIVGFTSMFSQNVACFAMTRKLKERNPHIVTVMGGANCETPMGEGIAQNVEAIDFVFSGPALKSFHQFVGHCMNQEIEKCHQIRGVFSKTNCQLGKFDMRGSIGEELNINVKVDINYEAFLNTLASNFPNGNIKPNLFFETSRGCWWGERAHCTFCGLNGTTMNYRAMSPQNALEQFEALFKYYPECSYFECVDNIMPKNYLQEVFPFLNTPPNTTIFYEVKADLRAEDLQVMSRARVKRIQPGIESLATSTLKLMKKGTTVFQNLLFLKNCVAYDVEPAWNLLVGFPGEGEEVYKKYLCDIPLLTHLPPPSGAYPVRFDRYSPYFVQAEGYALDLSPYDFYELIYPFSKEVLANLAYYFTDNNFSAEYLTTLVRWINNLREKVKMWQNCWNGEGQIVPPKLLFKEKGESSIIYDSRAGEVIEHEISDVARQVLEKLTGPRRLAHLASDLSHIPNFNPEREVGLLQERGLIFQEGDRFMSLVLEEQPCA